MPLVQLSARAAVRGAPVRARRSAPVTISRRSVVVRAEGEDAKEGEEAEAPSRPETLPVPSAADLRSKSDDELTAMIEDANRTQLQMRFARSLRQPFNASNFSKLRKSIAIAKTIMREREIEQGIKPRASRAAKRKAQRANLMI